MSWHLCPKCKGPNVGCLDSRFNLKTRLTRRRYKCLNKKCKCRFTTYEQFSHFGYGKTSQDRMTFADKAKKELLERIEKVLLK